MWGPLADVSGGGVAIPVVPVVRSVAKDVLKMSMIVINTLLAKLSPTNLVLQECQAVLTVPIIGLISHPVVPRNQRRHFSIVHVTPLLPRHFHSIVIPSPVTPVVVSVMTEHMSSNPPLTVVLHPSISYATLAISFRNQRFYKVVLSRASTLVHVNQPPTMELAQNRGIVLQKNILFAPLTKNSHL